VSGVARDLATALKICEPISGDRDLESLIVKAMRAVIEHAGAQRALLIVPRGNELRANAIEAMSGIKERRRELTIASASDGPDAVCVQVCDSGTELDPKHAPHLFEPFYTTKAEGLGIGLSISRSILEAHGGSLSAAANPPYSTVFSFSLPVNEPAQ
jgi:C4-dicarboxylate-specific signal transduction histidine kinase